MLHLNTHSPTREDETQRDNKQPAFSENLFEHMLHRNNILRAWHRVRANKGAAGVDGMSTDVFPEWASLHWKHVATALRSGQYQPAPVRRVEIDKPDGGKRLLGIPTVLDRVIQQAIAQVLTPIFDPTFSAHSFGFRPNRNGQQAVKHVQSIIKQGRRFAVDVDLSKFFDRVNHDLLMSRLSHKLHDKRLLKLIGLYLRAGFSHAELGHQQSQEGVPQGGPLSPLLANIMLDPLDKELENRGHRFARYADDFTILVKSKRAGERVLTSISRYLQHRLKLVVNTNKSQVVKTTQSKFLGFTFKAGRIQIHAKTLHRFKQQVRRLTNRNWGVSMAHQLFKVSQYLRGWINYFGIANCYQLSVDLDHWIRRRVRMAYWRQWRKPRTKVANLMRRGVHVQAAVACGITSKGPWRSSKTPGIQQALSNAYLKAQGLFSLRDGWIALHHSK